jgi:hypothetical protein
MAAESFSIMCFSWNAAGLRFCSTMFEHEKKKGFFAKIASTSDCVTPDFFDEISKVIREKNPSLVVMSTQDEDISNTYFHAEFLETEMSRLKYSQLKRDKLDGVGETASKNPYDPKFIPSGKPSGSALRMSIYARNDIFDGLEVQEKKLTDFFSTNKIPRTFKCEKDSTVAGAIATYVTDPTYGKFVFITVHLPLGTAAAKYTKGMKYKDFRQNVTVTNNFCLQQMKNKFLHSISDPAMKPDHVIVMGDLNYDILIDTGAAVVDLDQIRKWTASIDAGKIKQLQDWDELKSVKSSGGVLEGFQEGVGANGPWFLPTWRMIRGRPEPCSKSGNVTERGAAENLSSCYAKPSDDWGGFGWHDRILYMDILGQAHYATHCTTYNRIDVLNMHHSTHAGVIATFEMKPIS